MPTKKTESEVQLDRRDQSDERRGDDRRHESTPVAAERRSTHRRKVQRRRQIDPTTCERDYTDHEIEFMQAMDAYKRSSGRMFPTCSEILEVIRELGYVRLSDGEVDSHELEGHADCETELDLEEELENELAE